MDDISNSLQQVLDDTAPKKRTVGDILTSKAWEKPKDQKVEIIKSTDVISGPINYPYWYPKWPNIIGAIPNLFLRSAIFGVGNSKKYLLRELIASPAGYQIYITGYSLTITDLHYLDILFSLADGDDQCVFTIYRFLKLLKHSDTGDNRKALKKFFSKLIGYSIDIVDHKNTNLGYEGSIIIDKKTNENTDEIVVKLNGNLRRFFQKNSFTLLDQQIAFELKNHPLAFWLYGYYSSHKIQYPIYIATVYGMCRSEAKNIASFKQCVKRALSKIEVAHIKYEKKFEWVVDAKGLLSVTRTPSKSQARSIKRDIAARK